MKMGYRSTILAFLLFLLFTGTALAHKVNIFAYAESGQIYTESYFPDGRPVAQGKVLVYDPAGTLLVEGETDAEGLYNFAIPKVVDLKIVIKASMGHRNSFVLKKSEVEEGQ